MAKIGEYRLSIYHLLYNTPLYSFSEVKGSKKEFNVLILGNGWAGNEAFKATFWVGQGINTELNITVASNNAAEYEKKISNSLPAFKRFADTKGYAKVRFINTELDPDSIDCGLSSLEIDKIKYNYVIVALGDASHNFTAATELMTRISDARDMYNGNVIINVFDEFSNDPENGDKATLIELGREAGINISFFGKESKLSDGELIRIAKNINFAYVMKYNQRAALTDADLDFMQSLQNEFIDSPAEKECGDLSIVDNFIGSNYTADSSIASALHIPYKLNICKTLFPEADPKETLANAIKTEGKLYKELVALEHRRWNAYMITRGYRAPTKDEEKKYLYREIDGRMNRHKDDSRLLHICLCDCGSNGAFLESDFFNQYRAWREKNVKVKISELDRASLRNHQLASEASDEIDANELLAPIGADGLGYDCFIKSVKKLLNDEENSLALYEKELEAAKRRAADVSDKESAAIRAIDRRLTPAKARNGRIDFLSLDAQLIEMIPFCLWYRVENRTVITVSSGEAQNDVVIPTLLCAQTAIFIHPTAELEDYRESVTEYFKKRGGNTEAQFITNDAWSVDSVTDVISHIIEKSGQSSCVINCVSHKQRSVSIAIGRMIERSGGRINAVSYDTDENVISLSGDDSITVGINNKSFSVAEYMGLLGGRVISEYVSIYNTDKMSLLTDLFKKFCDPINGKDKNGNSQEFIPWIDMSAFLTSGTKTDTSLNALIKASATNVPFTYNGKFRHDVYKECGIDCFLNLLSDFNIIRNLSAKVNFSDISVTFDGMEAALADVLSEFEEKNTRTGESINRVKLKALRFSFSDGFGITNRSFENKVLYNDNDGPKKIEAKKSFIKDLYNKGFISEPKFNNNGTVSFMFKDIETLNVLKTQGECFELIVYHAVRDSAMFDDVEKGTTFLWNRNEMDVFARVKKRMSSSKDFGYARFLSVKNEENYGANVTETVKNELDIVAIKGMSPTFISCKTGKKVKNEWLYEVDSIASHFHARAAMAIALDLTQQSNYFSGKAKEMEISAIGTDTLWNPLKTNRAMKIIADGEVYASK